MFQIGSGNFVIKPTIIKCLRKYEKGIVCCFQFELQKKPHFFSISHGLEKRGYICYHWVSLLKVSYNAKSNFVCLYT